MENDEATAEQDERENDEGIIQQEHYHINYFLQVIIERSHDLTALF